MSDLSYMLRVELFCIHYIVMTMFCFVVTSNIYRKNVSSCGNWLGESFLLKLKMSKGGKANELMLSENHQKWICDLIFTQWRYSRVLSLNEAWAYYKWCFKVFTKLGWNYSCMLSKFYQKEKFIISSFWPYLVTYKEDIYVASDK